MSCRVRACEGTDILPTLAEGMSCRVRAREVQNPPENFPEGMSCRVHARNDSPRWGQSPQNWGR